MSHHVVAELVANIGPIDVRVGSAVAADDSLMLLESMKMEIPVLAEVAGTVTAVRVVTGDVVREGDILVEIDPS
ncbi:MAG: biotin/lipoyl-binding carrier protein [Frankiaceae bacterium]|nr:biotin/lipoyl-binding carrier protein [Frankiaceae bacterium]